MKVLCIGNSTYDITLLVQSYPIENKKIKLNDEIVECGGGSASNVSYLLASWKIDTAISSVIGNDIYGNLIEKEYKDVNIDLKYLEKRDIKTSTSYIITNKENGSRTILINRDKNLKFDKIKSINEKYDYIYSDGSFSELAYDTIINNKESVSILDAGRLNDDTIKLCKVVDYIICSNDFARSYTNINFSYDDIDSIKKVYDLIAKDFKGLLIITLEKYGSFVKIDNEYHLIPSIEVKQIDSTGAGDIYHGAFLYFLSLGYSVLECMKYANIAGAISVTRIGGRNSIPTLHEVISYVK